MEVFNRHISNHCLHTFPSDCERLDISSQSGDKTEGDRVTITCNTDCNPPPDITLYKGTGDGRAVVAEVTSNTVLTKSNYRLTKEDNGIAVLLRRRWYGCISRQTKSNI